ncbi:MAG: metallophosphoesterase [Oligoflexia bacterium]|nr:metallophosphoesterase [Oligoflexia bacterium]
MFTRNQLTLFLLLLCGHLHFHAVAKAEDERPLFSFGLLTDIQVPSPEKIGNSAYEKYLNKLKIAVEAFNASNVEFVIQLGDLVNEDIHNLDIVLNEWNKLNKPNFHVLGNHDFCVEDQEKTLIVPKLQMPGRYYDFSSQDGSYRFLVLDGNDLSIGAYPKNSPEHAKSQVAFEYYMKEFLDGKRKFVPRIYEGGIGETQMKWIKHTLDDAQNKGQKVILFCHQLLYPVDDHNLWNADDLKRIVDQYDNIVAFMNGHKHTGLQASDQRGVNYITFKSTLNSNTDSRFYIIDVYPEHFKIKKVSEKVMDYRQYQQHAQEQQQATLLEE